jgi:hypothetical protein
MQPDRRRFLLAGISLAATRRLWGQDNSFSLTIPLELDLSQFSYSVVASESCTLELQFMADGVRPLSAGRKWGMEPKKPVVLLNQSVKRPNDAKTVGLHANVYPNGKKTPSIAGVIQGGPPPDPNVLGRTAIQVPFVDDPDPRPKEGHFTLDLRADSDVFLRIWRRNKSKIGPLVHERSVPTLHKGENPVPWDLLDTSKSLVDPGDFLGTLIAKPTNGKLAESEFFSTFSVI